MTSYRLIARDNWPGRELGTEDVFEGSWNPTPQAAVLAFKLGSNYWMRWSFALFIERSDGQRTWVHSDPSLMLVLDPPREK